MIGIKKAYATVSKNVPTLILIPFKKPTKASSNSSDFFKTILNVFFKPSSSIFLISSLVVFLLLKNKIDAIPAKIR